MTWRLFAVVVWLALWQVCHAGDLVSLASPVVLWSSGFEDVIFDGNRSTYTTFQSGRPAEDGYTSIAVSYNSWRESIRPTHYRITMPAHVPKKDYPSSWIVSRDNPYYPDRRWVEVTDAVFENGVYEGPLGRKVNIGKVRFTFPNVKTLTIADIELLGPRQALDRLWPDGKYPCSRRLLPVPLAGLGKIFSRPKPTKGKFSKVFDPTVWEWWFARFEYDDYKPIIIGADLQKPTIVREVVADFHGARKIVLQGNFCQPRCPKYGSKGWVKLAQLGKSSEEGVKMLVKNPDKYKAYRVKVYRQVLVWKPERTKELWALGLHFLECPE